MIKYRPKLFGFYHKKMGQLNDQSTVCIYKCINYTYIFCYIYTYRSIYLYIYRYIYI